MSWNAGGIGIAVEGGESLAPMLQFRGGLSVSPLLESWTRVHGWSGVDPRMYGSHHRHPYSYNPCHTLRIRRKGNNDEVLLSHEVGWYIVAVVLDDGPYRLPAEPAFRLIVRS